MKKRSKFIYVIIVTAIMLLSGFCINATLALSEEEEDQYSQDDILFYDPCTSTSSVLGGDITIAGDTAEEKLWSGLISFLTDEQAAGVMGNIGQEDGNYNPVRREVGQSGNLYDRGAQVGLGFIQWSFGRRVNLLNFIKEQDPSLIQYFEDDSNAQITGDDFIKKVGDDVANRIFQLEIQFLKNELDQGYSEYFKQTKVDDATVWFRSKVERAGVYSDEFRKQKARDAYNKYSGKAVTSSTGASSACLGQGNNNIAQTAIDLAWPLSAKESDYKYPGGAPTSAFTSAAKKVGLKKYLDHPDCGYFVSVVVQYSGYDESFPGNLNGRKQVEYAKDHPEKWDVIDWDGNKSKLKSGDIITFYGSYQHTFITVEENGEMIVAEASYNKKWGHLGDREKWCKGDCFVIRATGATNGTVDSSTGLVTSGQNNHDIGASALELAWPFGTDESVYYNKATDKFTKFFNTLPVSKQDKNTNYAGGKSCDRFVHTVVKYAGVDDDIPAGNASAIQQYLASSSKWEEVKMDNPKSTKEYQSGDVIAFGRPNFNHVGIYAEGAGGKGYVVQASNPNGAGDGYFGIAKDTNNITSSYFPNIKVYRNKENQSGGGSSECDVCGDGTDGDNGSLMGLKEGGLTLAEAQTFVKKYHDAAMGTYYKKHPGNKEILSGLIHDTNCPFGIMNNCVAFSQWFINAYTTAGPWQNTTNGVGVARKVASDLGLDTGTEPRPYAIFSHAGPSSAGHTGVILGVDEKKKKVVIGEASCSFGRNAMYYAPHAVEKSFSEISTWNYAYTDKVIKTEALRD